MNDPQVVGMAKAIRDKLPGSSGIAQAAELAKKQLKEILGEFSENQSRLFAEATELVRRETEDDIEVLHRHSLLRANTPAWYKGARSTDVHWPALAEYLKNVKGWDDATINSIDLTSTEIVSLLEDPGLHDFACRGLIVGYVQSGKTANMTAVIAKAVDAGYNLIVVLAGLTNALRRQTQVRLEADIVDRHRYNWNLLTHREDDGDFRMPANRSFQAPRIGYADIAVLKKNKSPLVQFTKTLSKTPNSVLKKLRVLVIDDECDQASVNASGDEYKLTVINEKIRNILSVLPCVSYVGYTATPFANVLINPYPPNSEKLDDLYPKDFITALPKPSAYFGTEDLFGRSPADAGDVGLDEEGFDMVRSISPQDEEELQPPNRKSKDSFVPQMPASLEEAALYFLACCAARHARGQTGQHMSMLVHTSAYVVMHERVAELLKRWIDENRFELVSGVGPLATRMAEVWSREADALPSEFCDAPKISFEQLKSHLSDVLKALEIPVENGFSDDRIDYGSGPKTYIVVGGSVLARGLTIEGLIVSYFLRSSSQYDTLLQMGRWFGYRPGYEDLPRIWMTDDLALAFRALATVEGEIRSDIEEFEERNVTPMEFAVRIRTIPGMAVTAPNKMRAARTVDVSFSGKHVQTIRFDDRDTGVVDGNWKAAANLLVDLRQSGLEQTSGKRRFYADVPLDRIFRFLKGYSVHSSHKDLSDRFLLDYIAGRQDLLARWNVGLWEPDKSGAAVAELGAYGSVRLNTRAKLKGTSSPADIKALMSRKDVLIDCPGLDVDASDWSGLKESRLNHLGQIPLLLLYPIDKQSAPQRESKARVALDAVNHLVGFGIVFPGSEDQSGRFISVPLEDLSADEIEEADIEA